MASGIVQKLSKQMVPRDVLQTGWRMQLLGYRGGSRTLRDMV